MVQKAALLCSGFGGQPLPKVDESIFKNNPLLGSSRNVQISVSVCTHTYVHTQTHTLILTYTHTGTHRKTHIHARNHTLNSPSCEWCTRAQSRRIQDLRAESTPRMPKMNSPCVWVWNKHILYWLYRLYLKTFLFTLNSKNRICLTDAVVVPHWFLSFSLRLFEIFSS